MRCLDQIVRVVLMVAWILCEVGVSIGVLDASQQRERHAAGAQPRNTPDEETYNLVVMIQCQLVDGESFGAGIIFGVGKSRLYIMTADHVVRKGTKEPKDLRVQFRWLRGEWVEAKLLSDADSLPGLDLAVLAVDLSRVNREHFRFDQLGDPGSLGRGDPLHSIGYPRMKAWDINVTPHKFDKYLTGLIFFQSAYIGPGNSGGALLNDRWELVGMVREFQPPDGNAVSIQSVVELLKAWGYPVNLQRKEGPPVPPVGIWSANGRGDTEAPLENGPSRAPGLNGQAFLFDGVDDVLRTTLRMSYAEGATFSVWFRTTADAGMLIADGGGASAERGMGLFIEPGGQLSVLGSSGVPNKLNFAITGPRVADGTFHHAVVTWSGRPSPGGVRLYVDGEWVASTNAHTEIATGSTPLHLGGHSTLRYRKFAGIIDEAAVYNYPLSYPNVQALYKARGRDSP